MRLVHHQFFQLNYFPALLLFNLLFHLFREGERKRSSRVFLYKIPHRCLAFSHGQRRFKEPKGISYQPPPPSPQIFSFLFLFSKIYFIFSLVIHYPYYLFSIQIQITFISYPYGVNVACSGWGKRGHPTNLPHPSPLMLYAFF